MRKQTRNYKTLRGFFNAWGRTRHNFGNGHINPFTFSDYLRGYFPEYVGGKYTQIYFNLSEEAKAELFELMAGAITSSKATRAKYAAGMAEYIGKDYGIFDRLWIRQEYHGTRLVGDYCAGQDWNAETRLVQSLIRKGSLYF